MRGQPVGAHGGKFGKQAGETDAWGDTPYFNDAERAALALTEAVTRLSDHAVTTAVPRGLRGHLQRRI